MTKIAIIRCEKNEARCPLTSCIKCLDGAAQGFSGYEDCSLMGVFTCRCPGDNIQELAKILKAKGAEAIHFTTCSFASKGEDGWTMGDGLCDKLDELAAKAAEATGLPCVKGSAHLPKGYSPETVTA